MVPPSYSLFLTIYCSTPLSQQPTNLPPLLPPPFPNPLATGSPHPCPSSLHTSPTPPHLQEADVLPRCLLALVVHVRDQLDVLPLRSGRSHDVPLLRHEDEQRQREVLVGRAALQGAQQATAAAAPVGVKESVGEWEGGLS